MSRVVLIKKTIVPLEYYLQELAGSVGNPTGKGWYAWNGLCPFHSDTKSGSFFINKQTGGFKCFSCDSSGGDVIAFHQLKYKLTFNETINKLKGDAPWNV